MSHATYAPRFSAVKLPTESSVPSLKSTTAPDARQSLLRIERIGRKIIFLGAPTRASVAARIACSESSQAVPIDIEKTKKFIANAISPATSTCEGMPKWRVLPISHHRIPTGFTQRTKFGPSVAPKPFLDDNAFLRHTLDPGPLRDSLLAENHVSSPIAAVAGNSFFPEEDENIDVTSFFTVSTPSCSLPLLPPLSSLTDLEDIPSASYIASIQPQTMTINTIVGIVSISPPREITTRYGVRSVITLIVGDETSAGLKVDAWVPENPKTTASRDHLATLLALRAQDVILIKNLALMAWKDVVEGMTLWKERTKIELVYRVECVDSKERRRWRAISLDDVADQQVRKVANVVRFVREFVCAKKFGEDDVFPDDDTQDV
ncbi:hypothetical protein RUND412_002621 [Rhizina undulata]